MIIFKKEAFNCQMRNMITLDDGIAGGLVYVNKETYDQALALSLIYNNDKQRVENFVAGTNQKWKENKALVSAIEEAYEELPSPLNMLSIFLIYSNSASVNWSIENEEEFAEQVYGILHMLSQFIDFYLVTTVPMEIRSKLNIPKNILLSYKDSWNVLTSTLGDFKLEVPVATVVQQPVQVVQQPVPMVVQQPVPTPAPVAAPIQPVVTPAPAPVTPTPAPVTPVAPAQEEASAEEEDDEDAKMQKMYEEMQAIFKSIDETPADELAKKQGSSVGKYGSTSTTDKKESSEKQEILTEDLKKEKGIAEDSVKILNSYDL